MLDESFLSIFNYSFEDTDEFNEPSFSSFYKDKIIENVSKIDSMPLVDSFYDNDLDITIQNLENFYNKDNSFFSNKKRGRSPIFKKDLSKINICFEYRKLNKSDDIVCRENNKYFDIKKNYNKGRKTLKSGLTGKHDKYCFDNISKRLKSMSFEYIREELNCEIEKLNKSELINTKILQFNDKQAINSSKVYNKNLMNKTFKEIYSEKISGKYKYEEDYNKKLIDKIYKLNETQKDEKIEQLKNFFDLKYNDFWVVLSTYLKTKDKEKFLKSIIDKYSFFKNLIKNFIFKVDKSLNKKNLDEDYKTIFKLILEDFPQRF